MKRIITLMITLVTAIAVNAQLQNEYTNNSYRQLFPGSFGGNYYCCGSTDAWILPGATKPFIQMDFASASGGGTSTGNGTTTGNNIVAYALGNGIIDLDPVVFTISGWGGAWGTTTDALTLNVTTPDPSSYGLSGGNVITGSLANYDARYALYMKLTSNNDGFWANASNTVTIGAGNPNMSLKFTNNTSTTGYVRVELYVDGAIWGGINTFREFSIPANTTRILTASNIPAANFGAVNFRTTNMVGQVSIDDFGLGLTFPSNFNSIATSLTSGVVTVPNISLNTSGTFTFDLDGDDLYDQISYVGYTITGATSMITVDGMGNFTTAASGNGVVTITAQSLVNSAVTYSKTYAIGYVSVSGYSLSSNLSVLTLDGINNVATLSNSFTPSFATNQGVYFTASSPEVVFSTVSGTVYATITLAGMYTITGTSEDGSIVSNIVITAAAPSATALELTLTPNTINVGSTSIATVMASPAYVIDGAYTISVDGPANSYSLASNSGGDTITGLSAGVITVTATYLSNPAIKSSKVLTINSVCTVSSISFSASSSVLGVGQSVTITGNVSGIVWTTEGTAATLNTATGVLTGNSVGSITITGTYNLNGCNLTDTYVADVTPGTQVTSAVSASDVTIYPNPASSSVSVSSSSEVLSITIIDLAGQVVTSNSGSTASVSGLNAGLYIVVVETAGGSVRKTLSVK